MIICPALKGTVVELGLVLFRASVSCLPGVWDFLLSGPSLPTPWFQQDSLLAAARGAEQVQSLPTSQTHWQAPCPCSDWHLSLSGTQWEPSGCFNSEHGQGRDRKRTENWKAAKHAPFFFPHPIRVCGAGVLFVCLPVCFCWEIEGAQGCGTRTLWPPASISPPLCFTKSPYDRLGCRTSTDCFLSLCLFSVVGTGLFFQFLPFLRCQLTPIISMPQLFGHNCENRFLYLLSCGFSVSAGFWQCCKTSLKLMPCQAADLRVNFFMCLLMGKFFPQNLCREIFITLIYCFWHGV